MGTQPKRDSQFREPSLYIASMFVTPLRSIMPRNSDRLVAALGRHERRLQGWIAASEKNSQLFRRDPVAAMREAGLEIEDDLMCELEQLMGGIAARLRK